MAATFLATAKKGQLTFSEYGAVAFRMWIARNEGHKFEIKKAKHPVSSALRAWYWAAVVPHFNSLEGWQNLSPEEVHEILKLEFNSASVLNPVSKKVENIPQTIMSDESNTTKAMEFIERLRQYSLENYSKDLPLAEEYKKLADAALTHEEYQKMANKKDKKSY